MRSESEPESEIREMSDPALSAMPKWKLYLWAIICLPFTLIFALGELGKDIGNEIVKRDSSK